MNFLLYSTTVAVWGSTWLAVAYQNGIVPAAVSVFYRFALASLLIFAWCFFKRSSLKFSWKIHMFFAAQGFFLFSINYLFAYEASKYIPSGLNAIGFSVVLVFNIINSALFYRTPLTWSVLVGSLSGIMGITTIFWPSIITLDLTNESLLGILLSVTAGILTSFGNMISARNQKAHIPVMESNAFSMGYGALWMVAVIFLKGISFQFDTSPFYVFSLLHLSLSGSVIAFGCYLSLLGRIGASRAAYALGVSFEIRGILSGFFARIMTLPKRISPIPVNTRKSHTKSSKIVEMPKAITGTRTKA